LFVIFLIFVGFGFSTRNVNADCYCNNSYCLPDSNFCPNAANPNVFAGSQFVGHGECTSSTTCIDAIAGAIYCGSCPFDYGDSALCGPPNYCQFASCVPSCNPGDLGEIGNCDWGCYPNNDESVTCTGEFGVCSPACSGATPRCCQKSICAATCYTVVPSNLSVTYVSGTKATLTWTPGGGGDGQKIYVGTYESVVRIGCPGGVGVAGCVVVKENIGKTQSSFTTTNVLVPGSTYYWMVRDYKNSSCFKNSNPYSSTYTPPVSPTCTLNLTGYPTTVAAGGGTTTYSAAVTNILNGSVSQVNFVSNKPSVVTVTSPDSSTPALKPGANPRFQRAKETGDF
jgi:hypothetical protein